MGLIDIDNSPERIQKTRDRFKIIQSFVEGKDVLDLGCINHDVACANGEEWLHGFLRKFAKSCVGVDYLKDEVKELQSKGFDIVWGNVEHLDLKRDFDVVIAGELIEHMSNFGLFLDGVSRHLRKDGIFIVTTPNAFSIRNTLRSLFFGRVATNTEHTCWFSEKTLGFLLKRFGFEIVDRYFYFDNTKAWTYYLELFFSFFRSSFAPGMIFIVRKSK